MVKIVRVKGYVSVRMPVDAYNGFMMRKQKMEQVVKDLTHKQGNIPLTRIFKLSAKYPIQLHDDELITIIKRVRRR